MLVEEANWVGLAKVLSDFERPTFQITDLHISCSGQSVVVVGRAAKRS